MAKFDALVRRIEMKLARQKIALAESELELEAAKAMQLSLLDKVPDLAAGIVDAARSKVKEVK